MQECYDKYVTEEIKERIMKREEQDYSVAVKLPPLNVEVIGYDEDWNEFTCAYDGEFWYCNIGDIPILCDKPKYWKYKNMED